MLATAVLIVKDEAASICATLRTCCDAVDAIVVLDTGSSDGTPAVISEWAQHAPVPVYLHKEPFVAQTHAATAGLIDFAATRNRALDLAAATDPIFTLTLSADETLIGGAALRRFLADAAHGAEPAYCVALRSGALSWTYPRVLRRAAQWRFIGAVHEVPVDADGNSGGPTIPDCAIRHAASDPARHRARLANFDLPTLTWMAEEGNLGLRLRAINYLAQTHLMLAEGYPQEPGSPWIYHKLAAMAHYRRVVELGQSVTDAASRAAVNNAAVLYLNIAEAAQLYSDDELLRRLRPLLSADPDSPEVNYMVAAHAARLDVRDGAYAALRAAKVAAQARVQPRSIPTDTRLEWLSYRLVAACARELKQPALVRHAMQRGLAAGAPPTAFAEFAGESA